jgi:uncharacterized RDD family membrane protein YckC
MSPARVRVVRYNRAMAEPLAAASLGASAEGEEALGYAEAAPLGPRLLAYVLDSIVLFAFTMLFATASFLNIFLRSESGGAKASDAVIWNSVIILMLTVPAWFAVSLFLNWKRGQTVGQYVLGLRLAREDGNEPHLSNLLVHALALGPLQFHPLLGGFWLLLGFASLSLGEPDAILVFAAAAFLLCLVSPVAALVSALFDGQNRTLHDRIAGIRVVRLE